MFSGVPGNKCFLPNPGFNHVGLGVAIDIFLSGGRQAGDRITQEDGGAK